MTATWQHAILEQLLAQRAGGERDFAIAWRRAANNCRARGIKRPRDFTRKDADADWLPPSTFFRRACQREWNGEVRADYLHLRDLLDDSGVAVSSHRSRLLA